MNNTGKTIQKTLLLKHDEDFAFLRAEGLKYIEELGSKLWTDYNLHDPGITILEALCYAITELGYRTSFPITELLSDDHGKIPDTQPFYTAKTILTQAPLTISDYRKLLVDIVGVHNSWFAYNNTYLENGKTVPSGEVSLYAHYAESELKIGEITTHPVYLSGLYTVLLDLENDIQLGDLNNGKIEVLNPPTTLIQAGSFSLTIDFPSWKEQSVDYLTIQPSDVQTPYAITIQDTTNGLFLTFPFKAGGQDYSVQGTLTVDLPPADVKSGPADIEQLFIENPGFKKSVILQYLMKIQKADAIVKTAVRTLQANRNLCEDCVNVTTIEGEDIAFCFDISLTPGTDFEQVQANVFLIIEEYLNPGIKFFLLKELVDKGFTSDEIFEGPRLSHGFIDTIQLNNTQLREKIHASDLIGLIMDLDGVQAVSNFKMTKFDSSGNPVAGQTGLSWCMEVTKWHKPVFSETKSKIIFYKNNFPYLAQPNEVRDTVRFLKSLKIREKLKGYADDLPIPSGKYMPIEKYTSIQELFPVTYGIGKAGLPGNAKDDRKAQVRQMRAYLLFFDQLLADFFCQLKNAKSLFSMENIEQSYYAQFIGSLKDGESVYTHNSGNTNLLKSLLEGKDKPPIVTLPLNPVAPAPADLKWQQLYEPYETFLERRNSFLDHLMARFAESFNDYVFLMFTLDYEKQKEVKIDPAQLIKNKLQFLLDYPTIGYERAKAFNYLPQKQDNLTGKWILDDLLFWDTDNVSGLEKRICRFGGIDNFNRRYLYTSGNVRIISQPLNLPPFQFSFSTPQGDTLGSGDYTNLNDLNSALFIFLDCVLSESNYFIQKTASPVKWFFSVIDNEGNSLAVSRNYPTKTQTTEAVSRFIDEFNKECDNEGLHLIEHILLRPRAPGFGLAPVCLNKNGDSCGEEDPYSFRISVVLPYWPIHLRSMEFRTYFEDIIRREAPAHTMVKICWVNDQDMRAFEIIYFIWLRTLATYKFNPLPENLLNLNTANDNLLTILFNLHSKYPVATLHDCMESTGKNPVMLGKTELGSFNN